MDNNKVWYDFFIEITKKITFPLLFRWEMVNGAIFHMFLPSFDEIKMDTFSPEIDYNKLLLNELLKILEMHCHLSGKNEKNQIVIHLIK